MSEMQQTRIPNPQGSGAWKTGWKGLGDGLSRQLWLLQSDALAAEARRRTGLEDFGEPPIEPVLSILANSLELQADLHPLGRFLTHRNPIDTLRSAIQLAEVLEGLFIRVGARGQIGIRV
jgi:hypothetical protein